VLFQGAWLRLFEECQGNSRANRTFREWQERYPLPAGWTPNLTHSGGIQCRRSDSSRGAADSGSAVSNGGAANSSSLDGAGSAAASGGDDAVDDSSDYSADASAIADSTSGGAETNGNGNDGGRAETPRFCPRCGTRNAYAGAFCSYCGLQFNNGLAARPSPTAAAVPQPQQRPAGPTVVPAGRCSFGCQRSVAPGYQRSGRPWKSCCAPCACASGQLGDDEHAPECSSRRSAERYAALAAYSDNTSTSHPVESRTGGDDEGDEVDDGGDSLSRRVRARTHGGFTDALE
jgi:hypothetical protein